MAQIFRATALCFFSLLVSGLGVASPTFTDAADEQPDQNPRSLTLGVGVTGALGPADLTVDGSSVRPEVTDAIRETYIIGLDAPLSRQISLGPILQLSSIPISSQTAVDASLLEAGLRAKLHIELRSAHPRVEFTPAAILAGTWSPFGRSPVNRRVVTNTTSSELGWSTGLSAGLSFFGKSLGGYLDIGYRLQGANFEVSQVPATAPGLTGVSEHSYLFSSVALTGGMLINF